MNIREEIESLALWFVIASLVIFILTLASGNGLGSVLNLFIEEGVTATSMLYFMSLFSMLADFIDNLAVGFWLFFRSKQVGYNKYLWCGFGFAGSLVGGALYFLARYTDEESPNKSLNSQAAPAGTPKSGAR